MLLQILTLLGALALLVFGMEMLSSGIQKFFGDKLRRFESWMKSRSGLKRILSGAGITAVLQSSSATTLIVVSLVTSATLTLAQGISVIMGANIGTTITAWILAALAFPTDLRSYAFVIVGAGFLMTMMKPPRVKSLGQAVLGLALVLVGLIYMKGTIPPVGDVPEAAGVVSGITSSGAGSIFLFLLAGALVAFLLQSSSAAVMLTMTLSFLGWLPFPMAAAMVLGENIGTAVSPNIVALRGGVQAQRTALAHLIFNLLGALIVLVLWRFFLRVCLGIISPLHLEGGLRDVFAVALAHTLFNVLSTVILSWFCEPFARLLCRAVKEPQPDKDEFSLKYIGSGQIIGTPAISIEQTYKECVADAAAAQEGFQYVKLALAERNPDKFEEYRTKLVKCEEITDRYEYALASFLNRVSTGSLSEREAGEIKVLYRVISELESLGDSCENISRLLTRLRVHKLEFDEDSIGKLNLLIGKVNHAFAVMVSNLRLAAEGNLTDISNAYTAEDNINLTRDTLRSEGMVRLEQGSDRFLALNYYLDMLSELEAMGDFMINVSQSLFHVFDK